MVTEGFSNSGHGRAVATFNVAAMNEHDRFSKCREILGYTKIAADNYRLARQLPKAHPQFPWLFAERISAIRGDLMTVEFTPRQYELHTDEKIALGTVSVNGETLTYAAEWQRYLSWEFTPTANGPIAIKYTWFEVPFSHVTHSRSYLVAGKGHVNQFDWEGFQAGTLLYKGYVDKTFTPAINVPNCKFCDVDLIFENVASAESRPSYPFELLFTAPQG